MTKINSLKINNNKISHRLWDNDQTISNTEKTQFSLVVKVVTCVFLWCTHGNSQSIMAIIRSKAVWVEVLRCGRGIGKATLRRITVFEMPWNLTHCKYSKPWLLLRRMMVSIDQFPAILGDRSEFGVVSTTRGPNHKACTRSAIAP